LNDQYVIVGKTEGVKECLSALHSNTVISAQNKSPLKPADFDNIAPIFSYADDEVRLNTFLTTVVMLKQQSLTPNQEQSLREKLKPFAFATTETSLNENGIERKTESSFGQFSTLMSLLQSSTSRSTNDSKR
jgi:malonyl CoA-acyl carrier protein transacylase